ncbi:ubiquitin related modifier 1 [Nematocida parisii]|uniref:Ubiquitin-related modifier 1 n=1 Tax=Nematocida parisii (strain ERTm3) TaxID=935791 RepID=I3EG26_NEMP3|nr:uncharacterized protein NEPG_01332 [Nematocida parisii ERTm1]EIJ88173.1 hypothetical protein NEQG_01617 [Nematocida parisii ERTm3]KAI5130424.1 ubiquitin related modifier 1 [Nematocida parisii]KAI5168061.1 ubiquitin related modifier 1 [Nematocida sp. AWRm79]KAI5185308.1 ubiquitin related modifier 1 [Nematocida sp. AWRm78]OAG29359.1 ubiquitin related modifier 1 [Nematocida sp. ERTm5]|eukprot:XP_013059160.1 hypothetical protein NEPG_01332 [Nematocida parisii ERTm1]
MKVIFRGGLEDNVNSETLLVDIDELKNNLEKFEPCEIVVKDLIYYIERNHLKRDYKHFSTNGELEGGILCIINEVDWDILNEQNTVLNNNDTIHFITTLHGG